MNNNQEVSIEAIYENASAIYSATNGLIDRLKNLAYAADSLQAQANNLLSYNGKIVKGTKKPHYKHDITTTYNETTESYENTQTKVFDGYTCQKWRIEIDSELKEIKENILPILEEIENGINSIQTQVSESEISAEIINKYTGKIDEGFGKFLTEKDYCNLFDNNGKAEKNAEGYYDDLRHNLASDEYKAVNGEYFTVSDEKYKYWVDNPLRFTKNEITGAYLVEQQDSNGNWVGMGFTTAAVAAKYANDATVTIQQKITNNNNNAIYTKDATKTYNKEDALANKGYNKNAQARNPDIKLVENADGTITEINTKTGNSATYKYNEDGTKTYYFHNDKGEVTATSTKKDGYSVYEYKDYNHKFMEFKDNLEVSGETIIFKNDNGLEMTVIPGKDYDVSTKTWSNSNVSSEAITKEAEEYYKSHLDMYEKYGEKFKGELNQKTGSITIVGMKNSNNTKDQDVDWAGETSQKAKNNPISDIIIDYDENGLNSDWNVNALTHELAHSIDTNCAWREGQYSNDSTFKDVCNQISEKYYNTGNKHYNLYTVVKDKDIGISSGISYGECWGRMVEGYYGTGKESFDPNDLKSMTVTVDNKNVTVYDYMSQFLD